MRLRSLVLHALCLASLAISLGAQVCCAVEFTVDQDDDGVTVRVDGQLFTRYLIRSGAKPILWPLVGPTGKPVTRSFPMTAAGPNERADHVHHRSFWFTHGDVNGTDFWLESKPHGTILHRAFEKVEGGDQAVIISRNDWIAPSKERICSDLRSFVFCANADCRWIDFDIVISAIDMPVKFGDTKEGCFGIRVAGDMKVEGNDASRIVNSAGNVDADAWGKQASWVDYHGIVDGETLGIAVMNHPRSFRFPTYWHVRTYGLFAANPFGLHNFKNSNEFDGSHTLQPGESIALYYRILLHKGDEQIGKVSEAFGEYAKAQK